MRGIPKYLGKIRKNHAKITKAHKKLKLKNKNKNIPKNQKKFLKS